MSESSIEKLFVIGTEGTTRVVIEVKGEETRDGDEEVIVLDQWFSTWGTWTLYVGEREHRTEGGKKSRLTGY